MAAKVNLYTEEFDTLIDDRGIWCDWYRASVCNCVSRDSGQPDFTCNMCNGTGFRYISTKRIKVGVMSLLGKWELTTLQMREVGTAYVTPKSDVIMGFRDRLVFNDFRCMFSEPVLFREGEKVSEPLHRNIKSVVYLADNEYEYEVGVDFIVSNDEHHLELIGDAAEKEMRLSILYYTTPSYLVDDLLHELRGTLSDKKTPTETFRELPKQYRIVREAFEYNVGNNKSSTVVISADSNDKSSKLKEVGSNNHGEGELESSNKTFEASNSGGKFDAKTDQHGFIDDGEGIVIGG